VNEEAFDRAPWFLIFESRAIKYATIYKNKTRIIDAEGMHNEIKQTLLYILYIKCVRICAHIYYTYYVYIMYYVVGDDDNDNNNNEW